MSIIPVEAKGCGSVGRPSKFKTKEERQEYWRKFKRDFEKTAEGKRIRAKAWFNYYTQKRLFLIQYLGNQCSNPKCLVSGGCTDIRCLQLDHKNGKGRQEIERLGGITRMILYYYKHLDEAKQNLQVLCANCNWIKREEERECIRMQTSWRLVKA